MSEQQGAKPRRSGDSRKTEKKGKTGWLVLLSAVLILVLAFGALAIYAESFQGIFPNTWIGDCDVSGLNKNQALKLLDETYEPEKIKGGILPLSCKKNHVDLSLDELKAEFDNPASVEKAIHESSYSNIFSKTLGMAKHLFSETRIKPVLNYDKEKLEEAFVSVIGEYEIEPVNYTFEIQEKQVVLHGKVNGVKAEREPLIAKVEEQLCRGDFSEVELELTPITPEPLDFEEFYKWLTSKPENAYYEKGEDGKVTVHPGKLQCKVDKETVQKALLEVDASPKNKITFPVTTKAPEFTTEALTKQLYQDVLGSYTTYYSGTAARNSNVQLATSRINGIELMPGDEFSYDKTILPRTYKNGYQAAPVYVGNKVESGLGGGICQPSSTLYVAALYANLEILERHNHSMLVSYLPAGLDATIAQGYLDLRLKNNTKYPIKIEGTAQGGKLTFRILGYNPENLSVEIVRGGGGYHYTATRIVKQDGMEISREPLSSSKYSPKAPEEPEEEEKPEGEEDPNATEDPNAPAEPDGATESGETGEEDKPDASGESGTPQQPEPGTMTAPSMQTPTPPVEAAPPME